MDATKVEIGEFRENLAGYLDSKTPVEITRQGATIGVYTPAWKRPGKEDLEAYRVAVERMQATIAAAGTSEEDLVNDFKKLRLENSSR